ncbi:BPI fold-containing family A member 5-like [Macrotis lagotis]|uniref:BPI fold-containing family A member 5-like n=1 Tax=Macrotis lagotis TaxID=92651 RepID=UPI003D689239
MKTLLLLGLFCGLFTLSLAEVQVSDPVSLPEKTGTKTETLSNIISIITQDLQNEVKNALKEIQNVDLLKYVENIPVLGKLIYKLRNLFWGNVSINVINGKLLQVDLQVNKDKQSLTVKLPLAFDVLANTFFDSVKMSVNIDTTAEIKIEKDKDGKSHLVVTQCHAGSPVLKITSSEIKLLGDIMNLISDIVNTSFGFLANDLICPVISNAALLIPSALVEQVDKVIGGNLNVNI